MTRHRWQFFLRAGEAWEAMYVDCAAARSSIDFEQYIMRDDDCGRRFTDLLAEKARAAVRVRLLCDMLGSHDFYNSEVPDRMRAAGCDVRFYNPMSPWRIARLPSWSRRDHRKMTLVDGALAHIGGVCIDSTMSEWRDTHVRIAGPVGVEVGRAFERLWNHMDGRTQAAELRPVGQEDFAFLTNEPHTRRNAIYRHVLAAIARARHYIFLTTPYYVPDHRFFRHLRRACRRGVDVRLLMPNHPDHPIVDKVSRSYWGPALKAGIRIFAYEPTMIHAKTIVIDDRWATVGSSNLDYLSFFRNQEGNLIVTKRAFALDLKHQFLEDLESAREVSLEEWRNRPFTDKIAGLIGRPIKKFL
ncbi:MAG TPA: phospholipase D-like domain-containing protein [Alphaproteobacteria bacterium]|nr:phospholipase D-like domain-containing protein [Alphaproteobacteria bacterium]